MISIGIAALGAFDWLLSSRWGSILPPVVPLLAIAKLALLVPFVGLAGLWSIEAVTGYFVILVQVALATLSLAVALARALVWRIAEYNKGAWAAITLLTTVTVGIADVCLRLR